MRWKIDEFFLSYEQLVKKKRYTYNIFAYYYKKNEIFVFHLCLCAWFGLCTVPKK